MMEVMVTKMTGRMTCRKQDVKFVKNTLIYRMYIEITPNISYSSMYMKSL
jgi:hypothetical protein